MKDFCEQGREAHTRIKSGRDGLTLLFCVNEIRFVIRTAIIYEAANQGTQKGNDCLWLYKKVWTRRTFFFFLIGLIDALLLKSGSTLPIRNCLLKFFLILGSAPWPPRSKCSTCSLPQYLNRPLNQGLIRTFKAHYTQDSIKRFCQCYGREL